MGIIPQVTHSRRVSFLRWQIFGTLPLRLTHFHIASRRQREESQVGEKGDLSGISYVRERCKINWVSETFTLSCFVEAFTILGDECAKEETSRNVAINMI